MDSIEMIRNWIRQ